MLFELSWDLVIYNVAWGCLIGGGIITAVSLLLAGMASGHEVGGHDLSHDLSADHDLGHDVGHDFSHDLSADHDFGTGEPAMLTSTSSAPFLLLLSGWLLWFGILGVATYYAIGSKALWLMIVLAVPVFLSYLLSFAWRLIAKSQTYKVPEGLEILGQVAVIERDTTDEGGMIRLKTNSPLGFEEFPARSLHPLAKFGVGEKVYLCDIERGIYLVDQDKQSIRRYKRRK
ncbi:MAG TPA: hypothetical protein VKK79_15935 [Candidatus Lokiarchaeia archaeon]|nr:hypothetical protein [Candidatus Lokiarchaeia archaeon]